MCSSGGGKGLGLGEKKKTANERNVVRLVSRRLFMLHIVALIKLSAC